MMFSAAIRQWNVVFKQTYLIYEEIFSTYILQKLDFPDLLLTFFAVISIYKHWNAGAADVTVGGFWDRSEKHLQIFTKKQKIQDNIISNIELKRGSFLGRKFSSRFLVKPTWELKRFECLVHFARIEHFFYNLMIFFDTAIWSG